MAVIGEKNILIIGAGLQGGIAAAELCKDPDVKLHIADLRYETANSCKRTIAGDKEIGVHEVDAKSKESIEKIIRESQAEIVIYFGPAVFGMQVAEVCIDEGAHFVSTDYPPSNIQTLDERAKDKKVAVIFEMGLDPGIDLVLALKALDQFKLVTRFDSFGSGISADPEHPLGWIETWALRLVLAAYDRPGVVIRNGEIVKIPSSEQFTPRNTFIVDLNGTEMDAYVNGDTELYVDIFGLDSKQLRDMGRYALRWPGHNEFWQALKEFGFLDETMQYSVQENTFEPGDITAAIIAAANRDGDLPGPVQEKLKSLGFYSETPLEYSGTAITARQFLIELLTPQVQPSPENPFDDLTLLRVVVEGIGLDDKPLKVVIDFSARGGQGGQQCFAMNTTVGGTAALAAKMILDDRIGKRGVLSPARKGDVPVDAIIDELERCGMEIKMAHAAV